MKILDMRFGEDNEAIVLYKCRFGSFEKERGRARHRADQVTFWKLLESQWVVGRKRARAWQR